MHLLFCEISLLIDVFASFIDYCSIWGKVGIAAFFFAFQYPAYMYIFIYYMRISLGFIYLSDLEVFLYVYESCT